MKTGTLSPEAQEKLDGYRAEIDALDKKLIALFKERIEIVCQVGKLKRSDNKLQCFVRSGREADMLRNIYSEFKDSKFHPEAACAIWRQIIAASTQYESVMNLITPKALESEAKIYFGAFIPVIPAETIADALKALEEYPASLIFLPLWQDTPAPWKELAEQAPDTLKVFAVIPFVGDTPQAYVAANLTPEPSEDDISIFIDDAGQIEEIDGYHSEYPVASNEAKGHKRWLGTYGRPIMRK